MYWHRSGNKYTNVMSSENIVVESPEGSQLSPSRDYSSSLESPMDSAGTPDCEMKQSTSLQLILASIAEERGREPACFGRMVSEGLFTQCQWGRHRYLTTRQGPEGSHPRLAIAYQYILSSIRNFKVQTTGCWLGYAYSVRLI